MDSSDYFQLDAQILIKLRNYFPFKVKNIIFLIQLIPIPITSLHFKGLKLPKMFF